MSKVLAALCLALLVLAAVALPAAAENDAWLGVMDAGPSVVLGAGGGTYPAGMTLKLLPLTYEGPIPSTGVLPMLEGSLMFVCANAGVDMLFPAVNTLDDAAFGASVPVVQQVGPVPARFGACYLDDVGVRPFVRLDLMDLLGGEATAPSETALALLSRVAHRERVLTDFEPFAAPFIAQSDAATFSLAWNGQGAALVYATAF